MYDKIHYKLKKKKEKKKKTQSASSHPGVFDLDLQWERLFLNASLENLKCKD